MAESINEKTRISLFAVLASAPIIFGFVFWLTVIYFKAETAYAETVFQRNVLVEIQKDIADIKAFIKQRDK